MPRGQKASSTAPIRAILVPMPGIKLPVGEGLLLDNGVDYLFKVASKEGHGRGVKYVLRSYKIQKANVAYVYNQADISLEEAAKYPTFNGVHTQASAVEVTAAPAKKRGPKPKAEAVVKPARKPKAEATAVTDKPKRTRRTKAEMEAAAANPAAPAKKRGPKPKAEAAVVPAVESDTATFTPVIEPKGKAADDLTLFGSNW